MAIDTPARIAVLGAGPIGLEAALYARYMGYDVDIYERGRVGENVLAWGHVRMFTPFAMNRSPLGLAALAAQDPAWTAPADERLLSGRELVELYLLTLAHSDLLVDGLHEHTEVLAVGRDELVKGENPTDGERGDGMFRLLLRHGKPGEPSHERIAEADVVIDATGIFGNHNWLGQGGIPAIGELAAQPHIEYGLPDVLGRDHQRYAGRHTLVVGDDDAAAMNVAALAELAGQSPDTWITWVVRNESSDEQPGPVRLRGNDPLGERAKMDGRANQLATDDSNHVTFWPGTHIEAITWHADLQKFNVRLAGKHAGELEVDQLIGNVGFRPDANLYRELHVGHCPQSETPLSVAANEQSGSSPQSLITAEPNFYILGAKSYGRGADFSIADGLSQIRDLFAIIGDRADLDIYATMPKLS